MRDQSKSGSAILLVARLRQEDEPCFIAGAIVRRSQTSYRTIKDFNGIGIMHTVLKTETHLSPCEHC